MGATRSPDGQEAPVSVRLREQAPASGTGEKTVANKTKEQQEEEVLAHLAKNPIVPIWWITRTQQHACAVQRLQDAGKIICKDDHEAHRFPFCVFEIPRKE